LDFSTVGVHILFHGLVVYELCLAVLFITWDRNQFQLFRF